MAFTILEDIDYNLLAGIQWWGRLPSIFAHSVFSIWIALALTRQRDKLIWGAEMLFAYLFAASLHGLWDYAVFTENSKLALALLILSFIWGLHGLCCYDWQLIKPMFENEPSDALLDDDGQRQRGRRLRSNNRTENESGGAEMIDL